MKLQNVFEIIDVKIKHDLLNIIKTHIYVFLF